jgi:hypothetical protein
MNVVREIQRLNEAELRANVSYTASWHFIYKNSAYVFVGGLDYTLSEGDLICIFSQYGEIVDCNLVRDDKTGQSKGFAFIAYEGTLTAASFTFNRNSSDHVRMLSHAQAHSLTLTFFFLSFVLPASLSVCLPACLPASLLGCCSVVQTRGVVWWQWTT